MAIKLYRVKGTLVEKVTVEYDVLAESGAEAIRLVESRQGERVSVNRQRVDKTKYRVRVKKWDEDYK